MLVDTHCHLTDPAFAPDRDAVLERMRAADVGRALVIESQLATLADTLAWIETDGSLGLATACHPHDAERWDDHVATALETAWNQPRVRAVGEIGLDYHYDHSPRSVQRDVFQRQIEYANARDLPMIIHAREADDDVASMLTAYARVPVVLHSFSSGETLYRAGLNQGWYFSFSGMVTFKSWTKADMVRAIPADRLLLETDAPYLAPAPYRGQRNEPAFVARVAERVAELRGVPLADLADSTTANASRLFWPATVADHSLSA